MILGLPDQLGLKAVPRMTQENLPKLSNLGFAPINAKACEIGTPSDLILSDPHKTKAIVLGNFF